jgi:hypothetical protein
MRAPLRTLFPILVKSVFKLLAQINELSELLISYPFLRIGRKCDSLDYQFRDLQPSLSGRHSQSQPKRNSQAF